MLYTSGLVIFHGLCKDNIRKYARILQKQGHPIKLSGTKLVTESWVLRIPNNKLQEIKNSLNYEPEIFHAPTEKVAGYHMTVYNNGSAVITGINEFNRTIAQEKIKTYF